MDLKFYECAHCGNIIAYVKNQGVPVMCCGEKMNEIIPGTVEASKEKHIPDVKIEGNKVLVQIGSVAHPMEKEHYIEWVAIQTKQGNQRKALSPNEAPNTCFTLCENDSLEAVYAYCNIHGLWKA